MNEFIARFGSHKIQHGEEEEIISSTYREREKIGEERKNR
jgi:hypothetical protein